MRLLLLLPSRALLIWAAGGLALALLVALVTWAGIDKLGLLGWPAPDAPLAERVALASLLLAYLTLLVALAALGAAILAALYGYRQLHLLIEDHADLAHQVAGHWLVIDFLTSDDDEVRTSNGLRREVVLEGFSQPAAPDSTPAPAPRHLRVRIKNVGPGTADDVRVHLHIPPQVARACTWHQMRDGHEHRVEPQSDGAWRLDCSIPVLHPSEAMTLGLEVHLDHTTPAEFGITATLGHRNARPRDHDLHVRLVEPTLAYA